MIYLTATGFQWWNEGVSAIRDAGNDDDRVYQEMLADVITLQDLADLTAALFSNKLTLEEKFIFNETINEEFD